MIFRIPAAALLLSSTCSTQCSTNAFTIPSSSSLLVQTKSSSSYSTTTTTTRIGMFFADEKEEEAEAKTNAQVVDAPKPTEATTSAGQLFDSSTLAEANDALSSVGWAGVAPMQGEGEMTSEDPFVQQIDASVRGEMGVGLDELLNPAKVVNLERDLYNLRNELATLTSATIPADTPLTTELCDNGGGGEDADAIRATITKKEKDLSMERRAVFRGWLKNVFLGQALLSMALSYVMSTNPQLLFGNFDWFNRIDNMDTSIMVLGFWWWWLFIVPSLRSRRPSGLEKKALDIAFLGTPAISLLSPVVTKDTGLIWMANFAVVAGAYGFAYLGGEDEDNGDGDDSKQPGWLKFIYKSLDFGSGRERGARS